MIGMDTTAVLPQALLGAVQSRLGINSPTDDTYCDLFLHEMADVETPLLSLLTALGLHRYNGFSSCPEVRLSSAAACGVLVP